MPGCGNVGISRLLRDSQGAVEREGKLLVLFLSFHGTAISIAFPADATRELRSRRQAG